MKIAYLSNLYGSTARGGAERVVAAEAEAMAAAGHNVLVASLAYAGAPLTESGPVRVFRYAAPNLYAYPDGHGRAWATRLLWHGVDTMNRPSARLCRLLLQREHPDVVHTHNLMGLGFSIPAMIRSLGIRHVHTVHDVQLLHPSGLLPADFEQGMHPSQRLYIKLMRQRMGSPDVVLFPSAYLRDLHERLGFFPASKKMVASTPAPAVSLQPRAVPVTPAFLFVGQLEEHKGIRFLLDAWARWSGPTSATLVIIGDGSLAAEVRTKAATMPSVTVIGSSDRDGVLAAMDRSAFAIVPSLVIENSPSVIAESFSRGTPVIAAKVGGIPESVVDGQTGFLFTSGDTNALIAALDRATASLPEWRAYFERCCQSARRNSFSNHTAILEQVYKN